MGCGNTRGRAEMVGAVVGGLASYIVMPDMTGWAWFITCAAYALAFGYVATLLVDAYEQVRHGR